MPEPREDRVDPTAQAALAAPPGAGGPVESLAMAGLFARLRGSPLVARLAGGALFSLVGAVLARGLAFVATAVVSRQLSTAGFGEFGTIQLTAGALGVFAGFGLGVTATRALAQWRASDVARAGRTVALALLTAGVGGAVLGVVLAAAAPWLASGTLKNAGLASGLALAALLLPLGAVSGVQSGALAGLEAFRALAVTNTLAALVSFPVLVVGVRLGGRDGAIWGLIAGLAATCLINHLVLTVHLRRAGVVIHWRGALAERTLLYRFSLPTALASSLVIPMNWVCCTLLANRLEGQAGYVQLGLFNAAQQWRQLALFIPLQLVSVAMPMLTRLHSGGEHVSFRRVTCWVLAANVGMALAMGLAVVLLSPLMLAPFGAAYASAGPVLPPLMACAVAMTANSVLGTALNARGESWSVLAGTLLYALIAVGFMATPLGADAVGLAVAQLCGSAAATAMLAWRLFAGRPAQPSRAAAPPEPQP